MAKSKLYHEVLHKFIEKLRHEKSFENDMAEKLYELMESDNKIKSSTLTSIFCKEDIVE